MVEFALVVPIVLMLILGIIQYGYHYWALSTAAASAREAARELIVGVDYAGCVAPEAQSKAAGPAVGSTAPTVTTTPADPRTAAAGSTITVKVEFQSLDIGIFPVPDHGVVSHSASARVENVPAAPLPC